MRSEFPLFSILIANYNNAIYIKEAFQSVLDQSYTNWEVIVVDDASTDESIEIIKKWKARDSRIKLIAKEENGGCGTTKHQCVMEAQGEICGFLDPDDRLHPLAVEKMVEALKLKPTHSMAYSNFYYCDERLENPEMATWVGPIPKGKSNLELNKISHFCAFKRTCYNKTRGIDPTLSSAVDKDLYFKLEETGDSYFVDEPLYYYRKGKQGISQSERFPIAQENFISVMKSAFKRRLHTNIPNLTKIQLQKRTSEIYFSKARYYQENENTYDAVICLTQSFFAWPAGGVKRKITLLLKIFGFRRIK